MEEVSEFGGDSAAHEAVVDDVARVGPGGDLNGIWRQVCDIVILRTR